MELPDAPTEEDTERDGFLSYASEWHAAAIGAAAGLFGGLSLGSPIEPLGIGAMGAVVVVALGIKGAGRLKNKTAVRELDAEPWYGLGFMFLAFTIALFL